MASAPAEMNAKPAINALNAGIVQPNSSAHFNRKAALLYVSHTRAAYCTITGQCESKNFVAAAIISGKVSQRYSLRVGNLMQQMLVSFFPFFHLEG